MNTTTELYKPVDGATPEEIIEGCRQRTTLHGNDLDLLSQSMLLIEAGYYREALGFALRVQPSSPQVEELPTTVDKATAQAAFIAGHERARPLYEQAAREIEGKTDGSSTMDAYYAGLEMLRTNSDW